MAGWVAALHEKVLENDNFRQVVYTAPNSQLVAMTLRPNEDIGLEVHDVDQFLYIVAGEGSVVLEGKESDIYTGMGIVVPRGTEHNILNTSGVNTMQLFTLYAPPEHPDGTVHATKADAEAAESEESQ